MLTLTGSKLISAALLEIPAILIMQLGILHLTGWHGNHLLMTAIAVVNVMNNCLYKDISQRNY